MVHTAVRIGDITVPSPSKKRYWLSPEMVRKALDIAREYLISDPNSVLVILPNGTVVKAKQGTYGGWVIKDPAVLHDEITNEAFHDAISRGLAIAVVPNIEVKNEKVEPREIIDFIKKRWGDEVAKVAESLVKYSEAFEKHKLEGEVFIARPTIVKSTGRYVVIDLKDSIGPIEASMTGKWYEFYVRDLGRKVSGKVLASSYIKRILKKIEKEGGDVEKAKKMFKQNGYRVDIVEGRMLKYDIPDDVAELLGLNEEKGELKKEEEEEDVDIDSIAEEFGLDVEVKPKPKPKKKVEKVSTAVETKKNEEEPEEVKEAKKRVPKKEEIERLVEDYVKREGLIKSRVIVFDLPTEYKGAKTIIRKNNSNKSVEETKIFSVDPSEYRKLRASFYNVLHKVAWRAKIGWVMYESVPLFAEDLKRLGDLIKGLNQMAGTRRAVEVIDIFMPKDYMVRELKSYIHKQEKLAEEIRQRLMQESLKKTTAKSLRRQLREIENELVRLKKELEDLLN